MLSSIWKLSFSGLRTLLYAKKLGSLRVITFLLAILRVPSARQVVITAGKTFGDGRYSKSYGDFEVVDASFQGTPMRWIKEVLVVDGQTKIQITKKNFDNISPNSSSIFLSGVGSSSSAAA